MRLKEEHIPSNLGSLSRSSSIKCFKCLGKWHIASQCPNKRNMVLGEDENMESEHSQEESLYNSEDESSIPCQGKDLLYIIDSSSYVNVASLRLVEKLNLPALVHSKPYKLEVQYEILCDMVPIEATHILLGRPRQYDRNVIHDGVTNKFYFVYMEQKVTLKLLSPKEVSEDQLKMKIKREKEQKE
ncbi:hypothetical protein CR513_16223, partial [Mucuna pruriens]